MTDEQPTREPLTDDQIEMYHTLARSIVRANETEPTITHAYPVPIDVLLQLTEEVLKARNQSPFPLNVSLGMSKEDAETILGSGLPFLQMEVDIRDLVDVETLYKSIKPTILTQESIKRGLGFQGSESGLGVWNYERTYAALRYLADYNPMLLQNLACMEDGEGHTVWLTYWDGQEIGVDHEIALTLIKAAEWAEANGDPAKGGRVKLREFREAKRYIVGIDPAAREGDEPAVFTEEEFFKPGSISVLNPTSYEAIFGELFGGEEPKKIDPADPDAYSSFAPPSDEGGYHE